MQKGKIINAKAIAALANHDWHKAQQMLFQNAKENPCYQTWNNLGYYLISEGLICKNGSFRSAAKLGFKYLEKAAEEKESVVNLMARVSANELKLRSATKTEKESLYKQSYWLLSKAIAIKYSDVLEYNALRFSYLLNFSQKDILLRLRELIKTFVCDESVSFYLELLRQQGLKKEALQCINNYSSFLDSADLLLLFSTLGEYDAGYQLCEEVIKHFCINKVLAAAVVECYVGTGHVEAAKIFTEKISQNEEAELYVESVGETQFFSKLANATYRKDIIVNYKYIPPFVPICCYYGCEKHKTSWENE